MRAAPIPRDVQGIVNLEQNQLGAIHKGRPHPRGEGGLAKSGHMRTQGGGGLNGKKRTSSNFRSLNSVLCAKRRHLIQQLII